MKTEPSIDKTVLKKCLKNEYNLVIQSFKFVPVGEVASSYIVTTEENEHYFLKLYFPSRLINKNIYQLDFSIEVAHQLHHIQGINNISYPIQTIDGELKSQFQEAELVLWNFINGKIISEKRSKKEAFAEKLAELLAQIHNSGTNLKLKRDNKFQFEISFKEDLLLCLREIATCTTSTDKTFLKLKNIITPLMNDILQSLTYLEEITQNLETTSTNNFVVCHTDPIRHNVLLDKQDKIYLVDWDCAQFAPFEQDIWFHLNKKNSLSFKNKYKETRESTRINDDIVVYLFYERVLADLTDWVFRILFEETNPVQVESDFQELDEDVIPVLPNMKEIANNLRRKAKEW